MKLLYSNKKLFDSFFYALLRNATNIINIRQHMKKINDLNNMSCVFSKLIS